MPAVLVRHGASPPQPQDRAALVSAAAMAVVLGANAFYNVWRHHQEEAELRRTFEQHATGFARLTYQGLAEAFEQDGPAGEPLIRLAASHLDLEPDFQGIVLLDPEARVVYQALRQADGAHVPAAAVVREAARSGRLEVRRSPDPGDDIQILAAVTLPMSVVL